MINQTDELCNEYKQVMNENKLKFYIIKLKNCEIINDVLFRKDLLWISENMHTKLLQEVHDQSSIFHLDNKWIINLVQRFYYWSNHWATIRWYIWNCHACQRSQVFRNSTNELHHSLLILQKRWKDIAMNFIIELSLSEDYNIICIIIYHLIKERHYVFCHWEDNVLRVCRDWIEFSSQQVLEILTHVESLASTLYSSAFDIWANLLRLLCFALL